MQDQLMKKGVFKSDAPFRLESGKELKEYHLAYTTYGEMNADKSNVVWIFHALTANSEPHDWWSGLVGVGKFFDPEKYFIVCVNMPGSCYGSSSPLDTNPETNQPYYHNFPMFTVRDMVKSYIPLRKALGIEKIKIGMGGSMGGQQLLEWSILEPGLFEYILPIATNAKHSPWGIAFNATQRLCIEKDPTWENPSARSGIEGMKIARAMALISYRHYETYENTQQGFTQETENLPIDQKVPKSESYQIYQGEKLGNRFNAFSYYLLGKAMDTHDLGRSRESLEKALSAIKAKAMVIGISSDLLFPPEEQAFLARHIPNARLEIIDSFYGHDGFLLEFEKMETILRAFIE